MSGNVVQMITTVEGAAKALRNMAENTAKHSQNWDNYEKIVLSILTQIIGVAKAQPK